jgi:hypothetical protein
MFTLNTFYTIIDVLGITHRRIFYLKTNVSETGLLSPSSGKSLLSWTQPIELVPVSVDGRYMPEDRTLHNLKSYG